MIHKSRSILIVEDETIVTLDLEQSLIDLGYRVCGICHSAEDAIERAEELKPDLILMDIHLRGQLTGIEGAVAIRKKRDVPVVFLTAYADESTLQDTKRARPYGYLVKPFEERDLQVTIEIALHQHYLESQTQERERWLSTVMENVDDAIVVSDSAGRIRMMNARAQQLTEWGGDSGIGRDVRDVLRIVNGDAGLDGPNLSVKRIVSRSGKLVPVVEKTMPILNEQGIAAGQIYLMQDDSEAMRAVEERAGLAQKLAQAKDESDRLAIELASRTQTLLSADRQSGTMYRDTIESLAVPIQALLTSLGQLESRGAVLDPEAAGWLAESVKTSKELDTLLKRFAAQAGMDGRK